MEGPWKQQSPASRSLAAAHAEVRRLEDVVYSLRLRMAQADADLVRLRADVVHLTACHAHVCTRLREELEQRVVAEDGIALLREKTRDVPLAMPPAPEDETKGPGPSTRSNIYHPPEQMVPGGGR